MSLCAVDEKRQAKWLAFHVSPLTTDRAPLLLRWRLRWLLLLALLLSLVLDFLSFVGDLHVRAEPLVVLVLHLFTDVHIVHLEVQRVVRNGVHREPVFAVHLLAP